MTMIFFPSAGKTEVRTEKVICSCHNKRPLKQSARVWSSEKLRKKKKKKVIAKKKTKNGTLILYKADLSKLAFFTGGPLRFQRFLQTQTEEPQIRFTARNSSALNFLLCELQSAV